MHISRLIHAFSDLHECVCVFGSGRGGAVRKTVELRHLSVPSSV